MAWDIEMTEILRVLVNDPDSTTYSDERLQSVLVVAAFQVSRECEFSQDFVVAVSDQTIVPDPTEAASKDESYTNLVCLKAACIIDRGAAATAANQAIAVKDGSSSIDLRGQLQGKLELLKRGWCAVYGDAKFEHQLKSVPVAGAAVMTPFRAVAMGRGAYPVLPSYARDGLYH